MRKLRYREFKSTQLQNCALRVSALNGHTAAMFHHPSSNKLQTGGSPHQYLETTELCARNTKTQSLPLKSL